VLLQFLFNLVFDVCQVFFLFRLSRFVGQFILVKLIGYSCLIRHQRIVLMVVICSHHFFFLFDVRLQFVELVINLLVFCKCFKLRDNIILENAVGLLDLHVLLFYQLLRLHFLRLVLADPGSFL